MKKYFILRLSPFFILIGSLFITEVIASETKPSLPEVYFSVEITQRKTELNSLKHVKIFQIGFNRCGTFTLSHFFNANRVKSVHYDRGALAVDIWKNYIFNKPLISQKYEEYNGYFDIENVNVDPPLYIAPILFKKLDEQYPGSKFILNIRDKTKWIKSRSRHLNPDGSSYLKLVSKRYNIPEEMVLQVWSEEWDRHIKAVLEYFKDRPNDLLVFDIEKDGPEKLRYFFRENFRLDVRLYKHKHKTKDKEKKAKLGSKIPR